MFDEIQALKFGEADSHLREGWSKIKETEDRLFKSYYICGGWWSQ